MTSPFENLSIDHVQFYVHDLPAATAWLVDGYGLPAGEAGARSAVVSRGDIRLVLTQPPAGDHPGAVFLDRHGDGVADIALRVGDVAAAYGEAVRRGARSVNPPTASDGGVTATVMAFGDVTHTFVQQPRYPSTAPAPERQGGGLRELDHVAVCVEGGQLEPTIEFYERVLDFNTVFQEYIEVGEQAMDSKVVQSPSGRVTLTVLAPDLTRLPGQIDEFLKNNAGAGVQHLALATDDIVASVGSIAAAGVEFLKTPASYYRLLGDRLQLARHSVAELRDLNILADQDHDGQLYQIFASSVHPRRTFFMEIIERLGARTFGSGNIKALYEAVEAERNRQIT